MAESSTPHQNGQPEITEEALAAFAQYSKDKDSQVFLTEDQIDRLRTEDPWVNDPSVRWIITESQGNSQLLERILERERLSFQMRKMVEPEPDRDAVEDRLYQVGREIREMKEQLGLPD